ncbi:DUF3017 domain-containing protein [Bifidobacterium avesanii]|uniref:DUF3017 domain-containing protein n=1 Tax=Bifidobacterium avesanii TaxID=1798157 RepID=A0A7K3TED8_9BIFI|nr:DUF3017 domain-containing protein [Bifidobacterium avesanii]KAB8295445.1 rod shape-determining protein RodA [Bifidobacterium avesanii]NEG77451.1 DUF3017 domain-containing protein [Bifidobacterium avesanii]
MPKHPFVSESHEGNPVYEWGLLGVVVIAAVVAVCGYTTAATAIIAVAAVVSGLLRLALRERSPFKVRSVSFDAFISIALGLGLGILDFSVRVLF